MGEFYVQNRDALNEIWLTNLKVHVKVYELKVKRKFCQFIYKNLRGIFNSDICEVSSGHGI